MLNICILMHFPSLDAVRLLLAKAKEAEEQALAKAVSSTGENNVQCVELGHRCVVGSYGRWRTYKNKSQTK